MTVACHLTTATIICRNFSLIKCIREKASGFVNLPFEVIFFYRIIRSEYPLKLTRTTTGGNDFALLRGEIVPLNFTLENDGSLTISDIRLILNYFP